MFAGLLWSGVAGAGAFNPGYDIEGTWALNLSLGTSWRATNADADLISIGNGGRGGSSHDDGNLNFGKGQPFSTIAKAIGELQLQRDGYSVFVRGKAWYDYTLENTDVKHGNVLNRFEPDAELDDSDFTRLSRFSGIALLDAYVSKEGQVFDHSFSLKLGNQVVNWGEATFISGINQFGAVDVSAARRPGAQVKEVLLPIPMVSGSFSLTDSLNLEAFYQLARAKTIVDGCGTYWSGSDLTNCNDEDALVGAGAPANLYPDQLLYNDVSGLPGVPAGVTNYRMGSSRRKAKVSGQFGVASRYFFEPLSTEFGLYFVNYNQRTQTVGIANRGNVEGSFWNGETRAIQTTWTWRGDDIKVLGLSAATSIAGWSVFGESSYTQDFPVQLSGVDLLRGALGSGPLAFLQTELMGSGGVFEGFDRKDKAQIQLSTLKVFPRVLGAETVNLLGEVAYQHWTGIGNPYTDRRYGRGFVYGFGETASVPCASAGNSQNAYCANAGYFTSDAWGYRLQLELSYPRVLFNTNWRPRVFWSQDVDGWSADNQFSEDRHVIGLATRIDYRNRYYGDFSYTRYNHNATFDQFHDRDFYSAVVGINF